MAPLDVVCKAICGHWGGPLARTRSEAESFDVAGLGVMRQGVHKGLRIALEYFVTCGSVGWELHLNHMEIFESNLAESAKPIAVNPARVFLLASLTRTWRYTVH